MTTAATVIETYAGPRCQSCGGPCWQWKGSIWHYTCSGCLTRHLDASAARAAERDRRERARLVRKIFRHETSTSVTSEDRRRDGAGPCYVPQHRPGVDP